MIKKILKDVLGENFTENNEKYAKINFIIVILMFLVSAIMLFFLPEKIMEIPIILSLVFWEYGLFLLFLWY